jgi:hypothetical protein
MSDRLPTIRDFISSPADVRAEQLKAEQIIARLDREFAYHFHVEAVLWEREPLVVDGEQFFELIDNNSKRGLGDVG